MLFLFMLFLLLSLVLLFWSGFVFLLGPLLVCVRLLHKRIAGSRLWSFGPILRRPVRLHGVLRTNVLRL